MAGRAVWESSWGYRRICGELRTLVIQVSKRCIANIQRHNNLPPGDELENDQEA
jgi:hypothetical protein